VLRALGARGHARHIPARGTHVLNRRATRAALDVDRRGGFVGDRLVIYSKFRDLRFDVVKCLHLDLRATALSSSYVLVGDVGG